MGCSPLLFLRNWKLYNLSHRWKDWLILNSDHEILVREDDRVIIQLQALP